MMTSRERVQAVLDRRLPDRVPIDLGGTRTSSISVFPYIDLKKRLGMSGSKVKVVDVFQMLPLMDLSILEQIHSDVVMVPRYTYHLNTTLSGWKEMQLLNGSDVLVPADFNPQKTSEGSWIIEEPNGVMARMPDNGYYFDYIEDTYSNEYTDVGKIAFETWTDEDFRFIEAAAADSYSNTDKALVGDFAMGLGRPFSYEEWMVALALEKDYLKEYYDRKSDHIVEVLKSYREAVDDRIDIVFFGQDFGTQNGEMISPAMFEEIIAPYYAKLFTWIHQNTGWKTLFHSCGSIFNLIPHLIECGVDILNPVQTSAVRMDPAELKRHYGDKIVFWGGGVDTQDTLPFGTPDAVREQVTERIRIFGKGGGYIFNPVHNIQQGVPLENIRACFEAAFEAAAIYQ